MRGAAKRGRPGAAIIADSASGSSARTFFKASSQRPRPGGTVRRGTLSSHASEASSKGSSASSPSSAFWRSRPQKRRRPVSTDFGAAWISSAARGASCDKVARHASIALRGFAQPPLLAHRAQSPCTTCSVKASFARSAAIAAGSDMSSVPRQAVVMSAMRLASPAASPQAIESVPACRARARKACLRAAPGERM